MISIGRMRVMNKQKKKARKVHYSTQQTTRFIVLSAVPDVEMFSCRPLGHYGFELSEFCKLITQGDCCIAWLVFICAYWWW